MKYTGLTPYNYCANNPVMLVDPNGMYFEEANEVKTSKLKAKIDKKITRLEKTYESNLKKQRQ